MIFADELTEEEREKLLKEIKTACESGESEDKQ